MTVCAPNLALEHLSKDASPCIASRDQRRDVGRLARKMVEFQHDDVRLAAVHAGVLLQERDHSKAVLGAIAHGLGKKASLLPFVIPLVVQADGLPRPSSTLMASNASPKSARTSSAVSPVAGPPGAKA